MYKRLKDNKGITLISLGIVIAVLLIVSTTMILSVNNRYKSEKLDKLASDLQQLTEKTGMYYLENKQYPTKDGIEPVTVNGVPVHELDLTKMDGLSLNYGSGAGEDYYAIDISTGTVYYKKGIEGIYNLTQADKITGINVVKILKQPEWQKVREGRSATFSVELEIPEGINVSYEWWATDSYNDAGTEISGETDKTLIIENVTVEDAKYYYCKIIYNGITIKSDVVKLGLRDYIDYKIYGNTIEGVSVGDFVTDTTDSNYGKYKIHVTVSGKNLCKVSSENALFTNSNYANFTIDNHLQTLTTTGNILGGFVVEVKPSTTYSVKIFRDTSSVNDQIRFYEFSDRPSRMSSSDPAYIKNTNYAAGQLGYYGIKNYKVSENTKYVICGLYMTRSGVNMQIQLENGQDFTEYEPYVEPVTTNIYLNEPLRKLGDVEDHIDFNNQKVVRYIKEENGELSLIEGGPEEIEIQLPEILELDGATSIITVDSIIQPSKIEAN